MDRIIQHTYVSLVVCLVLPPYCLTCFTRGCSSFKAGLWLSCPHHHMDRQANNRFGRNSNTYTLSTGMALACMAWHFWHFGDRDSWDRQMGRRHCIGMEDEGTRQTAGIHQHALHAPSPHLVGFSSHKNCPSHMPVLAWWQAGDRKSAGQWAGQTDPHHTRTSCSDSDRHCWALRHPPKALHPPPPPPAHHALHLFLDSFSSVALSSLSCSMAKPLLSTIPASCA